SWENRRRAEALHSPRAPRREAGFSQGGRLWRMDRVGWFFCRCWPVPLGTELAAQLTQPEYRGTRLYSHTHSLCKVDITCGALTSGAATTDDAQRHNPSHGVTARAESWASSS